MLILAIYPGHNAAICLLRDGEVLLNVELERFTRTKHDYGFRNDFLDACLANAGVSIDHVDLLAVNRWLGSLPFGREGASLLPFDAPDTGGVESVPFRARLRGREIEAIAVNHHLAHAASAFFTSPFDEAAIFTIDGGGDAENASFSRGIGNRIESYEAGQLIDLASWWSSLTLNNYRMPRVHEWDPGSGAGKLMALAAYSRGDPAIQEQLDAEMHASVRSPGAFTDAHAGFAFNGDEDASDTRSDRSQALARAIQDITEREITRLFGEAFTRHPAGDLCYAGGLALNCIANTRALLDSPFERLHVPPCPNDTGLALGMALYAWHHVLGNRRQPGFFSPYTGFAFDETDRDRALRSNDDAYASSDADAASVADLIARNEVVCVCRGRSECGPRALGGRSILCSPAAPGIRDQLNERVKLREWYRPFAPIVLAEHAAEVFDDFLAWSPYMTTSATISPRWRERLDGVNHVDNTTRPQILERAANPFLHDVLTRVHEKTGIPVVLNTSFNRKEPIVESPSDALSTFAQLPVDHLVLGDRLLSKRSARMSDAA